MGQMLREDRQRCPIPGGCGWLGYSHGSQDECLEALRHRVQHLSVRVALDREKPYTLGVIIRRFNKKTHRMYIAATFPCWAGPQGAGHWLEAHHRGSPVWVESWDQRFRAWVHRRRLVTA